MSRETTPCFQELNASVNENVIAEQPLPTQLEFNDTAVGSHDLFSPADQDIGLSLPMQSDGSDMKEGKQIVYTLI